MSSDTVLALAAVILAAGAFIVAFLQVILEYMSSSTSRNMCSVGAIGASAEGTKYGWSFGAWKLKVYYPILRMNTNRLLWEFMRADIRGIELDDEMRKIARKRGWVWQPIQSNQRIKRSDIADHYSAMIDISQSREGRIANAKDLDWSEYIQFLWYRLRHPLKRLQRPRASWAQILTALGIRETRGLVIDILDAETVPGTMDTPIQRIGFRTLGELAFILGFKSVELDIPSRTFRAFSPLGTITTQPDNVLGKVLRFEGDIIAIHTLISRCLSTWIFRARDLISGQISFGKYQMSQAYYSLNTVKRAVLENMPTGDYDVEEKKDIIAGGRGYATGPVYLEASLMKGYLMKVMVSLDSMAQQSNTKQLQPGLYSSFRSYADKSSQLRTFVVNDLPSNTGNLEGCMARWQAKTGSKAPTIYAAATFMTIHSVVTAFPTRSLLVPFIPWVRRRAKVLYNKSPSPFRLSNELSRAMTAGTLTLARETSDYLMSTGKGESSGGLYGWGVTKMREAYDGIPEIVQHQIVPDEQKWEVNGIVTSDTAKLLRNFELEKWATFIREANNTGLLQFNAINCLWIQIIVLDIAIQYYIHGHWGFEPMNNPKEVSELERVLKSRTDARVALETTRKYHPLYAESWGLKEAGIVSGIVRAWRPPNLRQTADELILDGEVEDKEDLDEEILDWKKLNIRLRDWDLAQALQEDPNIVFGDDPASRANINRTAMCSRLAELLELRAIFVVAYLILHPDSSDIYESAQKEEDIEMPMA